MQDFEKFYNNSLRFLSYRPRSEKEIRDYLAKKKASISLINSIVKKLKEQKFLDDLEFARWFIRSKSSTNPKAARIIKIELRRKGIAEEIIDGLLAFIDDLTAAKELVSKKKGKYKTLDKKEMYQKLASFLARRGFSWDTIKEALKQLD